FIAPNQCVFIYSRGYPFPHYLYGPLQNGGPLTQKWNLTTSARHILQIEFNDFDVISTPGQHYCDADLLTIEERHNQSAIGRKVDYCNINRFNIGKLRTTTAKAELILRTWRKKVGNSRGIHATIYSVPAARSVNKRVQNVAEGKPTDQSSTRAARDPS